MTTAAVFAVECQGRPPDIAFGSIVDLARMQIWSPSAEVCDACNTINARSARCCKCCSHKLPAFYASGTGAKRMRRTVSIWAVLRAPERAWAVDFAAFSVVIGSLVVVTAFISIP
jgi:hypothetical protein